MQSLPLFVEENADRCERGPSRVVSAAVQMKQRESPTYAFLCVLCVCVVWSGVVLNAKRVQEGRGRFVCFFFFLPFRGFADTSFVLMGWRHKSPHCRPTRTAKSG